ncbi:MAG: LPS export ABC transporter permease LptF [Alphaproteobacteria bacterium]|nr:LPS export ABC transporter permease LptF [Alphaproteobacteria bacterium]
MLGITRYILKQLTVGTLLVSAGLICILWLSQSLRFIDLLVKKGLTVLGFIKLTMLLLPNFAVIISPIALFAVILFTYNRLEMDRELVVLKTAGLSDIRLASGALVLGLAMTVVGYGLTLYLVPESVQRFRAMQWAIRNDLSSVLLQEGTFTEVVHGVTVYVRSRTPEGELRGILVYDRRNPAKPPLIMLAERGALIMREDGPRVLMVNGNRQDLSDDGSRLGVLYFDSYTIELNALGGQGPEHSNDPRERSIKDLLTLTEQDGLETTDMRHFRVEAHQRLTEPLYNLSLAVLALASLLPVPFNRRGHNVRVVVAVALMVIIEAAALGAAAVAGNTLAALPLLYVVAIVPPLAGIFILIRPPEWLRRGWLFPTRRDSA